MTDPPFGVNNLSNMAVTQEGKAHARKIANDESPLIAAQVFTAVMGQLLVRTAENCDAYVFTSYQVLSDWLVMCDSLFGAHSFKRKAILIWEKDGPGMGDLEVPWGMGVEFILFYRKGSREKSIQRRNAVLHYPQVRPNKLIHPHEKPLPLLEDLLKASTDKHDFVVDPFGGSSSLARACRRVDRSAVTIELDAHNVQLARKAFDEGEGAGFGFD